MTLKKINIEKFLELAANLPVIDVRSPAEFESGHIPEAINIPLFYNDERIDVGTRYKKNGRIPAIIQGLKHAGPDMSQKLVKALKVSKDNKLLIHCWRGGMRSEAMAWLFSLGSIDCQVLDGGYKAYRNFILDTLSRKRKVIVLGGLTGSGKTHILRYLKKAGENVIDLEGMANHKGSAFGSLGQAAQPTTEHFANILYSEWNRIDRDLPLWLEDESRNIGSVFMPEEFYLNMQDTPAIVLIMSVETRMPRLLEEYSSYPVELLKNSVLKISKRLGGDNTRNAVNAIDIGDFATAIEITLNYYDKAYLYGLKKKSNRNLIYIETNTDEISVNANKVLEASRKISW